MELRAIHADSTRIAARAHDIAALFDSIEDLRQKMGERAAADPDCAHIVLNDRFLSRVADLQRRFVAEPYSFDYGAAQEVLKAHPELRKTKDGGSAYYSAEKYRGDMASLGKTSPTEHEEKNAELNSIAKTYSRTLAELRELVRTDPDCAEAVAHDRKLLAYQTADGDTLAHDVARNRDNAFVLRFVEEELGENGGEYALVKPDDYGWTPLHWAAMDYDIAQDILELAPEQAEKLTGIKDNAMRSVGDIIRETIAREDRRLKELSTQEAITAAMRSSGTTREMALSEELRGLKTR